MSVISGSRGIVYFMHEWKPSFREDAIFRYPYAVREVGRLNAEIEQLAPVLNAGTPVEASIEAATKTVSLVRQHAGAIYVLVAALESKPGRLRIKLPGHVAAAGVAIGEDRAVPVQDGIIEDDLPAWGVRLYKVQTTKRSS